MVPNCISSMTRKASGTWSSDRDSVMSVAALYFCRERERKREREGESKREGEREFISAKLSCIQRYSCVCVGVCGGASYTKSPVSIYGDDEVNDVNDKSDGVDVTHRTVLRVDDVIEELPDG